MADPRSADGNLPEGGTPRTSTLTTAVALNNIPDSSLAASQAVTSTTRLSYNNGYGDFCFGRLIDRHSEYHFMIKAVPLIDGSAGVPVIELGGYRRY